MINKNPYLIGQRTLDLLTRIEMDAMMAADVIENGDVYDPEDYGRYYLMRELGRELEKAFLADLAAEQIDPQLG